MFAELEDHELERIIAACASAYETPERAYA